MAEKNHHTTGNFRSEPHGFGDPKRRVSQNSYGGCENDEFLAMLPWEVFAHRPFLRIWLLLQPLKNLF